MSSHLGIYMMKILLLIQGGHPQGQLNISGTSLYIGPDKSPSTVYAAGIPIVR